MTSDPSNDTLPSQVDARKLAVKGVEISAKFPVSRLTQFVDLLANDSGSVAANLRFYIDEQRFRRLDGRLSASIEVCCQRCLEPMPLQLEAEFELGIVWSEEDSMRLPASLEPLIIGEELTDLTEVISEELILSLPYVSYHAQDECKQLKNYSTASVDESSNNILVEATAKSDNPFKVLEQLKLDK